MPDQSHRPRNVTSPGSSTGGSAAQEGDPDLQDLQGNAAVQDMVSGAFGRVFNRMLGVDEQRTDTASLVVTGDMLRRYLDQDLQLAEGEWFRGKKLDGVRDALIEQLDKDGDGAISWAEFGGFRAQTLELLAPGGGGSPEAAAQAARGTFNSFDRGRDGAVDYDDMFAGTREALPGDTDHRDLVAQLGARIALDAGDTDQRRAPVKDRELSVEEWTAVARELARGGG